MSSAVTTLQTQHLQSPPDTQEQGMPVVIQSPVAKSPHFAPAHVVARQASGIRYNWQALASQSSHSPGDCLTTGLLPEIFLTPDTRVKCLRVRVFSWRATYPTTYPISLVPGGRYPNTYPTVHSKLGYHRWSDRVYPTTYPISAYQMWRYPSTYPSMDLVSAPYPGTYPRSQITRVANPACDRRAPQK
eukprot:scaffold1537_cov37-Cyclotella_meneghiniana.AAC.1